MTKTRSRDPDLMITHRTKGSKKLFVLRDMNPEGLDGSLVLGMMTTWNQNKLSSLQFLPKEVPELRRQRQEYGYTSVFHVGSMAAVGLAFFVGFVLFVT